MVLFSMMVFSIVQTICKTHKLINLNFNEADKYLLESGMRDE